MRHHKKRASSHDGARVNVSNTSSLFIQFDRLFFYNSSIYLLILTFFPLHSMEPLFGVIFHSNQAQ